MQVSELQSVLSRVVQLMGDGEVTLRDLATGAETVLQSVSVILAGLDGAPGSSVQLGHAVPAPAPAPVAPPTDGQ